MCLIAGALGAAGFGSMCAGASACCWVTELMAAWYSEPPRSRGGAAGKRQAAILASPFGRATFRADGCYAQPSHVISALGTEPLAVAGFRTRIQPPRGNGQRER